jgi:hypothetical protein
MGCARGRGTWVQRLDGGHMGNQIHRIHGVEGLDAFTISRSQGLFRVALGIGQLCAERCCGRSRPDHYRALSASSIVDEPPL